MRKFEIMCTNFQPTTLQLEKKQKKEDEALRKALPGLYREVARETGEYTDNMGNTATGAKLTELGMAKGRDCY